MDYLNAFLCGGILCAIGQILIDKTPLTPARILTGYVVCGVLLTAIGVYEPIVKWGGAGATVPLRSRAWPATVFSRIPPCASVLVEVSTRMARLQDPPDAPVNCSLPVVYQPFWPMGPCRVTPTVGGVASYLNACQSTR